MVNQNPPHPSDTNTDHSMELELSYIAVGKAEWNTGFGKYFGSFF